MENFDLYSGFKLEILRALQARNENERKPYEDVINLTNGLYDSLDFHLKENRRLIILNANLKKDGFNYPESGSSKYTDSKETSYTLFQEEITDLKKQNTEYAQQVLALQNTLDEKEKEIDLKSSEIRKLTAQVNDLDQQLNDMQLKLLDSEKKFQLTKDNYDALLLTYSIIEDMKLKLEQENQLLINEVLKLKEIKVERMNEETELFQRKKQAKLQKELEEAAKEPVSIDVVKLKNNICLDAIVPKKVQYKFDAHDGEVNTVSWTRSDLKFVTAGGDRKVKLWDFNSGQCCLKGTACESNSSVFSTDFDAEESFVLAASGDFASRIWSINDMKIKHTLTGHSNKVMSAKFLGDPGQVVSGSHDRTLKIWDLRRRACTRTILANSSVNDVVTSDRNATNIVSGHFDKKIRFWDTRSESSTNEILMQGRITSLDLSCDGNSLLSCVRDASLKMIDFRMNKVVQTFVSEGFLIGCDWTRAKFSPDGKFCVCGSQDGCIYLWVISSGSLKKILKEHSATVIACAWSWCGNFLLSCDKNKKAVLWTEF